VSNAWNPASPYNALPPLPPAVDLETKRVLKQCIRSAAALSELDRAAELIPNPDILIGTLPFLEAQASSAIENVVTTTDRMFRYVRSETAADSATREALRYRHALMEAFGSLGERSVGSGLAQAICSRIKGGKISFRSGAGVMIARPSTAEIVYTPPADVSVIGDLMNNWETFLHAQDELEPLLRMAVAHYQFEAIHPFPDGNAAGTHILFQLPASADVTIEFFTVGGRLIRVLEDIAGVPGANQVYWDGRDQEGDDLANGVYLYRISAVSDPSTTTGSPARSSRGPNSRPRSTGPCLKRAARRSARSSSATPTCSIRISQARIACCFGLSTASIAGRGSA